MRVALIVLDSCGIGPAPDAADYGDDGAATLPHTAAVVGGLHLKVLASWGLGNIPPLFGGPPIVGVPPVRAPEASYGAMEEQSEGKDTITGHWEIGGLWMRPGFQSFSPGPPSFPEELIREFERRTGRRVIGNRAADGVAIMNELGPVQMATGAWIVYTSADSVFQICAHEEVIPLEELYHACEIARELCNPLRVGRVIARPYVGRPGEFRRTANRRDYPYPMPEPSILEALSRAGVRVYAVGKIVDIFNGRGIADSLHTGTNMESQAAVESFWDRLENGVIMANFIDFDMLYGHRRDPRGYARALEQTDQWLEKFVRRVGLEDAIIITADHGNDPTWRGTDHTRERVPVLVFRPGHPGRSLGLRKGYYDVAATLAEWFGLPPWPRGRSLDAPESAG